MLRAKRHSHGRRAPSWPVKVSPCGWNHSPFLLHRKRTTKKADGQRICSWLPLAAT